MSRVLAGDAEEAREPLGPDALEPDQADAAHGPSVMKLRTKRRRQLLPGHIRVDAEVHQHATPDDSVHFRKPHHSLPDFAPDSAAVCSSEVKPSHPSPAANPPRTSEGKCKPK